MAEVVRVGDVATGTCYAHSSPISVTGTVIAGASSVLVNSRPAARIGDPVLASCGHVSVIVSGNGACQVEGSALAYTGCAVDGPWSGALVSGSSDTGTNE